MCQLALGGFSVRIIAPAAPAAQSRADSPMSKRLCQEEALRGSDCHRAECLSVVLGCSEELRTSRPEL